MAACHYVLQLAGLTALLCAHTAPDGDITGAPGLCAAGGRGVHGPGAAGAAARAGAALSDQSQAVAHGPAPLLQLPGRQEHRQGALPCRPPLLPDTAELPSLQKPVGQSKTDGVHGADAHCMHRCRIQGMAPQLLLSGVVVLPAKTTCRLHCLVPDLS